MSNQKPRNPEIDFGFHAVIPRTIRTGYKKLTPVQKWLYVCLKDLCGDDGTCYRSLRVLAIETGISTGMLSESIPQLHDAGLIHAEKKCRSTGGKPVWHITIVDIWKANAKEHPTKRSQNEQTEKNVHHVNDNVHRVNDKGKERSQNEQECSLCETEVITESNTINEAITGEATETISPPQNFLRKVLTEAEIQQRIAEIYQVYDTFMETQTVRNDKNTKGARELAEAGKTDTQLLTALAAIKGAQDQFDWNRMSLSVLSERIDVWEKKEQVRDQEEEKEEEVAPETIGGYHRVKFDKQEVSAVGVGSTIVTTGRRARERERTMQQYDREYVAT